MTTTSNQSSLDGTRVSLGRRLTFLLLSVPLVAAVALFIYLPVSDPDFRTVGWLLASIVFVVVFGALAAIGIGNALRTHSPLWGPMPTSRFARFLLASGFCGLVIAMLLDGVKWVEGRSSLLGQVVLWALAIVSATQWPRIRRAIRWLSLGDAPLP